MANTPVRNLRVEQTLWEDFGTAVEAIGATRTDVLTGFMRRFVAAMAIPATHSDEGDQGEAVPPSRS